MLPLHFSLQLSIKLSSLVASESGNAIETDVKPLLIKLMLVFRVQVSVTGRASSRTNCSNCIDTIGIKETGDR